MISTKEQRIQTNILKFFYEDPYGFYYAKEISDNLKIDLTMAKEFLKNLQTQGFLKVNVTDKWRKYPNPKFSLSDEFRAISLKLAIGVQVKISSYIIKLKDIRLACLTGRFVGNNKTNIDLLLVGGMSQPKVEEVVRDLSRDIKQEINYSIMSAREFFYRRNVKDKNLADILAEKHFVIINNFD